MSSKSNSVFSRSERRAALWAVVLAVAVAACGLMVQNNWGSPSLGAYAATAPSALPGVLDARPIG